MSSIPILVVLASGLCFAAPRETVRVPWSKVAEASANQKISIMLPSGTTIRGVVLAVEPQALMMDVTGTSNAKEVPKGMATLLRASVTSMEATRCSRKMRFLLTLAIPGGLLAATAAAMRGQSYSATGGEAMGVGIAVAAGGAVGGYYLGKSLDCHVTEIVVGE